MSPSSYELVGMTVDEEPEPSLATISRTEPCSESAIVVQSLIDDHTELREQVVRLRRLCLALSGNQAPADPGAAALVEEFGHLLIAHFAAEQGSEFFESRVRDQPRLLQRVERLQTEHGEIAAALGQVLDLCERRPPGVELSISVTHFLDMFDAHERAENAMIQDLVLLDEGGDGE